MTEYAMIVAAVRSSVFVTYEAKGPDTGSMANSIYTFLTGARRELQNR
jgi:hypothetical protein